MYSFFAFALKVCKSCYYDRKFFVKNINMGINKMKNFMLISNLLMPYCNKTFCRHPYQMAPVSSVRGGVNISPSFSVFRNIPEIFSVKKRKRGRAQRGIEPTVLTSIYKGTLKNMAISDKS
jgi:hypothetical protein